MKRGIFLFFLLFVLAAPPVMAAAPPVRDRPDLNYVNVLHALLRLDKFKPDSVEYLDAYSMVAHCDVVQGSFNDEFRWNQARSAVKKWVSAREKNFPTQLSVKRPVMFSRYDIESKYYLFSEATPIRKINTFSTELRPKSDACDKPGNDLLPSQFQVITNNPLTLPGLRLTEEQARDLRQKFEQAGNINRLVYLRFNIDILDADYIGPSLFNSQSGVRDNLWRVKGSLHSVEFFSDPEYRNRFYYFVPF
jgi:hypothetical protein